MRRSSSAMVRRKAARATALGAAALSSLTLVGCQDPLQRAPGPTPAAIGIDARSPEQIVLGNIYQQILNSLGYTASVTDVSGRAETDPVDQLREGDLDVTIACTGPLLERRDSAAAADLRASGMDDADLSVATYDALVGTFPAEVGTVDPSPAQGCAAQPDGAATGATATAATAPTAAAMGSPTAPTAATEGARGAQGAGDDGELPRNLVPLYAEGKFNRWTVFRLNFLTRVMATDEIAEMADKVRDGEPVDDVTRDWLLEYAGITYDGDMIAPTEPKSAPGA